MNQLVDSFSPIRPVVRSPQRLDAQYGAQWLRRTPQTNNSPSVQQPRTTHVNDQAVTYPNQVTSTAATNTHGLPYATFIRPHSIPRTQTVTQSIGQHNSAAQTRTTKKHAFLSRIAKALQIPLIILISVAAGEALQSLALGELVICIYAIYALIRHVSSHMTFQLTFIALLGILVLIVVGKDAQLANNFAVYSFLLLAVGAVSLVLENRRSSRI